ncbi:hypothetical protein J8J17_23510, partial [Mycobacterium tuberculosis]|nr:hypothetical protein [Mycobacterium tuberculosis]
FLAAIFVAELALRWRAPSAALSRRGFRALFRALLLCAVAIFLTPYGWHYPAQLVADIFHTGPRVGEAWNNAYQSPLALPWSSFAEFGV